jgi:hypothetical protein
MVPLILTSGRAVHHALGCDLRVQLAQPESSFMRPIVPYIVLLTFLSAANCLASSSPSRATSAAGAATQLVFSVQPSKVLARAAFSSAIQVSVEDANGNLVNSSASIALTLQGPNTQLLGGTMVNAANGIASFPNLRVSQVGQGYHLVASSSGLESATSNTFSAVARVLGWVPPGKYTTWGNDYVKYVLPNLDGVSLLLNWSSVDNTDGTNNGAYDFSSFDSTVQSFLKLQPNLKIAIVVSPVSFMGMNTNTPAYVFTQQWANTAGASKPQDVCFCGEYGGDQKPPSNSCSNSGNDTTGFPAVFETPFEVALQNFYEQVIQHYNSSTQVPWRSHIAYIRFGLAVGGEAYPMCKPQLQTLLPSQSTLTDVMESYAKQMYAYEAGRSPSFPVMAAPSGPQEAADASNNNLVLGNEDLNIGNLNNCRNAWCTFFITYYNQSPILELQTAGPTDPAGAGAPGSLLQLLPFAISEYANDFELWSPDLLFAFDPNYNPSGLPASRKQAYATAIQNLRH